MRAKRLLRSGKIRAEIIKKLKIFVKFDHTTSSAVFSMMLRVDNYFNTPNFL